MPFSLTNDMMRSIIMDHYSNPTHKHSPKGEGYKKIHMHSDNCIDDMDIFVLIENGIVKDACFDGVGCTIATSSTDIMCDLLIDKTIDEANYIIEQYNNMIYERPFDEDALDEAIVFVNTSKQASRIRCATIGYRGMESLLKE